MAAYEPRRERPARLHTLGVEAFLFLCLATALLPGTAGAQVSLPSTDSFAFATDGVLYSTVWADGGLVVGGDFRRIGRTTGGCVLLGHEDARVRPGFPEVRGVVLAIEPDGARGWFIGGEFEAVGATPVHNLAHVRADGSVVGWEVPGLARVTCIARHEHRLFVGGDFGAWSIDLRSGARLVWDPHPDAPVRAIVVSGDSVVLGGDFSYLGDVPRPALASVDLDLGTPRAWEPQVLGQVFDLAIDGEELFVAGYVISASGTPRHNLASFDLRTGRLLDWNPRTSGTVFAVAPRGDHVLVGGSFGQLDGARRRSLGAVDRRSGRVTPWAPSGAGLVNDIASYGERVYVAGSEGVGGTDYLMAFDGATGQLLDWNPGLIDYADALAVDERGVLVGGRFRAANAVERNSMAKLDLGRVRVDPWRTTITSSVARLAVQGSTLYASGAFIGSIPHHTLAEFDLRTGAHRLWPTRLWGRLDAMAVGQGVVYVGGDIREDRDRVRHLAALDARTGTLLSWDASIDGPVHGIALHGLEVFVAGSFRHAGGAARTGLAALDARTGTATPWRAEIPHRAAGLDIKVAGDAVVASGQNRIAAFDRDGRLRWWDYRFHPPFDVDRGYVYVSDLFVPDDSGILRLDLRSGVLGPSIAPGLSATRELGVHGRWLWAVHNFDFGGSEIRLVRSTSTPSRVPPAELEAAVAGKLSLRGVAGGLELRMSGAAEIEVELFDVQGRRSAEWKPGTLPPGLHRWSTVGAAPGLYFARPRVNGVASAPVKVLVSR